MKIEDLEPPPAPKEGDEVVAILVRREGGAMQRVAPPGKMLGPFGTVVDGPKDRYRKPVIKVSGPGKLPEKSYPGDAGYDVAVGGERRVRVMPGELVNLECDLDIQPPTGFWLLVVGRSSSFQKGLMVNPSVIDSGYRGALVISCRNVTDQPIWVKPGDRVAQLVPITLHTGAVGVEKVDSLDPSERGSNGFGSTGR